MPVYVARVRRIGLIVAGFGSGLLGLVVAWTLVRPGVIGGVGTGALLAILGLLVLPAIVYWTWSADTRAATRQAARARAIAEAQILVIASRPAASHPRLSARDAAIHTHAAEPRRRVPPAPNAAGTRSGAAGSRRTPAAS